MFTGIIEEVGRVVSIQPARLVVAASRVLERMETGSSIAVNGVCLTVTGFDNRSFSMDVMSETLKRSNLGLLKPGDRVNLENPLPLGGPLSGHLVQGHVDAVGKVVAMRREADAMLVRFEAPPEVMYYIVEKGFIAVDGISLTVVERNDSSLQVSIVGFTRQHTNLDERRVGDIVNLEVDIIAKYVAQFTQPQQKGITIDFLKEHGF